MYIDQSVFSTPTQAETQAFNPLSMIKGTLSSVNPYNVVWDIINYKNKTEQQDYMKALQEKIFQREDTAYQRTAADMRNAGLNPLSMQGTDNAGSAVSLPDVTSGTPSESVGTSIERFINTANNTKLALDTLKNSENDRRLNTLRTINEVAQIKANIKNTNLDSKSKQQLIDHMEREYKYMAENNLYDYDNGITQQIKAITTFLTTDLPEIKENLIKKYPYLNDINEFLTSGKLSEAAIKNLKEKHPNIYFILNAVSGGILGDSQEQVLNGTEVNEEGSSHSSGKLDNYLDATRPKWWQNLKK